MFKGTIANYLKQHGWQPGLPWGFEVDLPEARANAGVEFAAPVPDDARAGTRRNMLRAEVLDAEGRVLMPGFVDCHTHLCYAGSRLDEWEQKLSGVPCLINTSFNVAGEPIVCSPADAIDCFQRTRMDALAIGNFLGPLLLGRLFDSVGRRKMIAADEAAAEEHEARRAVRTGASGRASSAPRRRWPPAGRASDC